MSLRHDPHRVAAGRPGTPTWLRVLILMSALTGSSAGAADIPSTGATSSVQVGGAKSVLADVLPTAPGLAVCPPSASGATCGGSGPASQGDVGGGSVDVGAGNPINVTNGNKYQHEVDLPALPGVLGLEVVRHYNSALSSVRGRNGLVGRGWRLSYETTLQRLGKTVQIVQADGSRLTFERASDTSRRWRSADPARGFVEERRTREGAVFVWHWTHGSGAGRQLSFDDAGRLALITAPTGEFVSLLYDPAGTLRRVIDPQGRILEFHYADRRKAQAEGRYAGVERIVSPAGTFHYAYGTAAVPDDDAATIGARRLALVSVTGPGTDNNAPVRRYHYENVRHPTLLTGISIDAPGADGSRVSARLSTYAYDEAGRAVVSAYGDDVIHLQFRVAARHDRPGMTVLTNADGGITTYTVGLVDNAYRLLETRGAGCTRCGAVNLRYRYDLHGRLVETSALDPATGRIRGAERTPRDALGRIVRIDHLVHPQGKPVASSWLRRFEYPGDESRPSLIARPSIVAGLEHRVALRYNVHGQIVEAHESGYRPVDDRGRHSAHGFPIERTTIYRYMRINGRSLLAEIDGPLQNGPSATPADSDITRYEYDEGGNRITAVVHPAGLEEKLDHDAAGREIGRTPVDGVPVRYTLDAFGLPVRWQRGDAIVDIVRDGLGRPIRITLPDGETLHLGHDGPGGLGAMVSSLGRGWWLHQGSAAPMQLSPARAIGAPYPARNRRTSATSSPARPPEASWSGLTRRVDDFGRLVTLATDATGTEHFRHDLAGRLVERRFSDGWVWRWRRDPAGRVVAHSVKAPRDPAPTTTKLSYSGAHLVRIAHPAEIETRAHDALGRVIARTIERPSPTPASLAYREQYTYDAADRLTRHQLAEGGELRYHWGTGSQLHGIDWIDTLRPTTRLISPLASPSSTPDSARTATAGSQPEWTHGGYRFGNGTEARTTIGPDGRLSALSHAIAVLPEEDVWTRWLPAAHATSAPAPGDGARGSANLIDGWRYTYDEWGRMAGRRDMVRHIDTRFAFDADSRLIIADPDGTPQNAEYYAYDALGRTLGRRVDGRIEDFRLAQPTRTTGGLPERVGSRLLRYSADRRLAEVRDDAPPAVHSDGAGLLRARYDHNALGQRIRKTVYQPTENAVAAGTTQYLWHGYRLAAELVNHRGKTVLARRYVHAHGVPVAVIDYPEGRSLVPQSAPFATLRALWNEIAGKPARVHYVHTNEIGTPTAVTDAGRKVVWRATHSAYGEVQSTAGGDFTLDLRLPGQYHDAETGWHDNVLRTYDPRRGEYLEPDPLGPQRLTRPYAYAGSNPLTYADPLGLILFAFDGTNNDESSRTNVFWLREAYDDNDPSDLAFSSRPYYVPGPGTEPLAWRDDVFAYRVKPKVREQLGSLDQYVKVKFRDEIDVQGRQFNLENPLIITLDIIGFSRGAAAARDFANEVISRENTGYYRDLAGGGCISIRLRFMGLFDTVLSTQINGTLNLDIPYSRIGHVAHAVAVNEHRALFPLESAEISYTNRGLGANVTERGFIGAHADIGGGYMVEDGGDLSDVALNWMYQQAMAAGVPMKSLEVEQRTVTMPILHDESPMWPWTMPGFGGLSRDREVRYPDRALQQRETDFEGMTYTESQHYIRALPVAPSTTSPYTEELEPRPQATNLAGTVDMDAYRSWLTGMYGLLID